MRIEVLQELKVLTRWMSFKKAAEDLHITQSALSKQISELERETGLQLFERSSNRLHLTDAGAAFAEEASYIVSAYEAALDRCRAIQASKRKQLIIHELQQNKAMSILYPAAIHYQQAHASVRLDFKRFVQDDPMNLLESNELDIIMEMRFASDPETAEQNHWPDTLTVQPVTTEPTVLWYEKGNSKVETLDEITLDDLETIPIVTTSGAIFDYFGNAIEQLFSQHGKRPRFRASALAPETSSYFLADFRDGILLTTPGMLDDLRMKARQDIAYRILDDPVFLITTFAIAKKDNGVAADFMSYLAQTVEEAG